MKPRAGASRHGVASRSSTTFRANADGTTAPRPGNTGGCYPPGAVPCLPSRHPRRPSSSLRMQMGLQPITLVVAGSNPAGPTTWDRSSAVEHENIPSPSSQLFFRSECRQDYMVEHPVFGSEGPGSILGGRVTGRSSDNRPASFVTPPFRHECPWDYMIRETPVRLRTGFGRMAQPQSARKVARPYPTPFVVAFSLRRMPIGLHRSV